MYRIEKYNAIKLGSFLGAKSRFFFLSQNKSSKKSNNDKFKFELMNLQTFLLHKSYARNIFWLRFHLRNRTLMVFLFFFQE